MAVVVAAVTVAVVVVVVVVLLLPPLLLAVVVEEVVVRRRVRVGVVRAARSSSWRSGERTPSDTISYFTTKFSEKYAEVKQHPGYRRPS